MTDAAQLPSVPGTLAPARSAAALALLPPAPLIAGEDAAAYDDLLARISGGDRPLRAKRTVAAQVRHSRVRFDGKYVAQASGRLSQNEPKWQKRNSRRAGVEDQAAAARIEGGEGG